MNLLNCCLKSKFGCLVNYCHDYSFHSTPLEKKKAPKNITAAGLSQRGLPRSTSSVTTSAPHMGAQGEGGTTQVTWQATAPGSGVLPRDTEPDYPAQSRPGAPCMALVISIVLPISPGGSEFCDGHCHSTMPLFYVLEGLTDGRFPQFLGTKWRGRQKGSFWVSCSSISHRVGWLSSPARCTVAGTQGLACCEVRVALGGQFLVSTSLSHDTQTSGQVPV